MKIQQSKKSEPKANQWLENWKLRSLELMRIHSKRDDVEINEMKPDFPVHGHWLTMSTLNSDYFKLNFKMFFSTDNGRHFCHRAFKKNEAEINHSQLNDFVKEMCNLMVGQIKQDLERGEVPSSVSLPMSLRGFDDLFFQNQKNTDFHWVFWKFTIGSQSVVCSLSLDLLDREAFNKLEIDFEDNLKKGTVEFL